jgi:RiboL-PSP-HEPN
MQSSLVAFKQTLIDLKNSLQRIRDVADDVLANTASALANPGVRDRHETVLCAVVVTLSGIFESFLRDVAEAYAGEIANKKLLFGALPDPIRYTHFAGGGTILYNVGRKNVPAGYRWIPSTPNDVARRLASVDGALPYELLWEAFAETKGNPGPDVVREFLSRFGVAKPMETLAAHVQKSHHTIHTQLDSFIVFRNECAHNGIPQTFPTANQVIGYCDLIEEVADGIVSVLSAQTI